MKKFALVLTLSLVLAAGLTCAPRLAVAGGHHHRGFHFAECAASTHQYLWCFAFDD